MECHATTHTRIHTHTTHFITAEQQHSQYANNGEIRILFTADLSQLNMICISSEVLTEDSSPGSTTICMHM